MIDDPDHPDYRYPEPGERLWHATYRAEFIADPEPSDQGGDEVPGLLVVNGVQQPYAIVKLRNLEPIR